MGTVITKACFEDLTSLALFKVFFLTFFDYEAETVVD